MSHLVVAASGAVSAMAQPPASVGVAYVVEREVVRGRPFVGTVMPMRASTVGSAVDGRVIDFPVNEGDRVEAGQTLARLKTETIGSEVAAARAEWQLRREELRELQNGTRPEEVEQAKATMLASKARMEYAAKEFDRVRRLYEQGSAANDELDAAIADNDEAHQRYLEAKAAYELAVAGARVERIAQAEARVAAAEQNALRLEDMLRKHTIVAPFAGYIVSEGTEIGEWVSSGQAVADVVELDVVEVRVLVVEDDIAALRLGAEARVEIPALPGGAMTGVVVKIVPQADLRSRSFPVHIRVENEIENGHPRIKAGMLARAVLPVGEPAIATLVNKDAIVLGGSAPVVFVVETGDDESGTRTVRPVTVELGVAEAGLIEVIGDLRVGQEIVTEGNERLRPGQLVTVTTINGEPTVQRGLNAHETPPTP